MLKTLTSPNGVKFTVWGRNSGPHIDLSLECAAADRETEDGKKFHGFLEHMKDEASCDARLLELEQMVKTGEKVTEDADAGKEAVAASAKGVVFRRMLVGGKETVFEAKP